MQSRLVGPGQERERVAQSYLHYRYTCIMCTCLCITSITLGLYDPTETLSYLVRVWTSFADPILTTLLVLVRERQKAIGQIAVSLTVTFLSDIFNPKPGRRFQVRKTRARQASS